MKQRFPLKYGWKWMKTHPEHFRDNSGGAGEERGKKPMVI